MEMTWAKTEQDLEEIADLMGKIFSRRSYFEFYENRKRYQDEDPWYRPEHSRVIKEDGKIVSHVSIIEKPVRLGRAVVKLAGIGDVFTHPSARRKGYSRMLMEDALRFMKANRYPLSMLYGIPNYYHRFGYVEAVREYTLLFPAKRTSNLASGYISRPWTPDDIPAMLALYRENCRETLLTVERNEVYMGRLFRDPERIVVITDTDDRLLGYAHLIDDFTRKFVVNEAMTQNPAVSRALITEIVRRYPAHISDQIPIRMPPTMPFVRHLLPLGPTYQITGYAEGEGNAMLAIIDLKLLLGGLIPLFNRRLQRSELNRLNSDIVIGSEKESVRLKLRQGEIHKVESNTEGLPPHLQVNHRYFVRNAIGYWKIDDLLQETDSRLLDDRLLRVLQVLFPEGHPYMLALDYF